MGALLVDLVTGIAVIVTIYARPTVVLGMLVTSLLLVPATLIMPHLHTSYATVNHVLTLAAALRLALMARQGHRRLFTATPLHLALGMLIVTWVADGLVFAPGSGAADTALQRVVDLGFVAGFFVVVLALIRLIDNPRFVMRLVVTSFAGMVIIAVVEHFTHQAYGDWLFTRAGAPGSTTAAHVLETRAGHLRVRSSSEFALQFAWIAIMLLPLVTVFITRMRRWVVIGLPLLAASAVATYWTYSRSAAAAIPVVLLLVAVLVRDRRATLLAASSVLVAAALFALDPAIQHHLSLAVDQGSIGVRFQRLPPILSAVSHHAFLGLGIGGLQAIGVPTTDNFYLYAYGDTGAVGAAVLVAVCLTALAQSARGLMVTDRFRRQLVVASLIGLVAFLVSGGVLDSLLLTQSAELVMVLLAIATAVAEPELGTIPMPQWSLRRVAFLSGLGAVAGVVALLLAPVTVSQERSFSTVSALRNAGPYDAVTSGRLLIANVCDIAKAIQPSLAGVHFACLDDFGAAGVGTLRVESPSATATLAAYQTLTRTVTASAVMRGFQTQSTGPPISARSTIWRTAPASLAAFGAVIGLIAPLPWRRRQKLHLSRSGRSAPAGPPPPATADGEQERPPVRSAPSPLAAVGQRAPQRAPQRSSPLSPASPPPPIVIVPRRPPRSSPPAGPTPGRRAPSSSGRSSAGMERPGPRPGA